MYQIEAEEGTPRSAALVRASLLQEKNNLDEEIQKVIDLLNTLTQDTAQQAKAEEARATRLNWIITAIATVLGLMFAFAVTRSLVEPIKRLLGGTRAVEEGDLGVKILVHTRDEIAVLADSFNHMALGLREKERIRETFGQYVDPRIVRGLLENRLPAQGGQRQVMSVFFSDRVGFTRLCESLTPDMAVRFLNRYFSVMSDVIGARQGIIDKYIGDSVMAFWGPRFIAADQHARLCCLAALGQSARLDAFRAELPELFGIREHLPKVGVRMGIASGEVTVGNIGSERARGYTVIGDTVNLAARLEQANKYYGTRILVDAATRHAAGDDLIFREIDSLRVVGKSQPAQVFELLGQRGAAGIDEPALEALLADYARALACYRARDWKGAGAAFDACLARAPNDRPSQVMRERTRGFSAAPPPDWDGVWTATGK